jgi:pimeloyl-ACP methyl ester carboxylesterase
VGASMGGAFAQLLALDFPDRILSLVLVSTSAAVPIERELPPGTDELARFVTMAEVDRSDADSVIEYLVAYSRVLAGGRRQFDEEALRDLARRDTGRARDFAAAQNHELLEDDDRSRPPLSTITVPTLVVHGTADPVFPPEHGEALAEEIPSARLLPIPDAGHGVERADWEALANAILEHTG